MNVQDFDQVAEQFQAKMRELLNTKGTDYSVDHDRLSNFKFVGQQADITPFQTWMVFACKHWTAISRFVKTGQLTDEPIEMRLIDLANYCVLLAALIHEQKELKQ